MLFLADPMIVSTKLQAGWARREKRKPRGDCPRGGDPATTYSPAFAVPSARAGLTALFGMGRGGAPPLWSPESVPPQRGGDAVINAVACVRVPRFGSPAVRRKPSGH